MYNIGILSTASIVPRFLKAIELSPSFNALGIASRDALKAKEFANKYQLERYYGSYEELIFDQDIDVVYLPLINSLHYEYGKKALNNGKHVIIEKPFVLHKDQAIELFEIAKANNVFLMEAQKALFLPTIKRTKELIANGTIGDVKCLEARLFFNAGYQKDHWMNDHLSGGGCLYGSMSYPFEVASYLFDIKEYDAKASFVKGKGTSDQLASIILAFGGKIMDVTIGMDIAGDNALVIHGEKGSIYIKDFHRSDCLAISKEGLFVEEYPHQSEFVYELEHIAECLDSKLTESPICTSELTIRTVALVEELYEQYYQ